MIGGVPGLVDPQVFTEHAMVDQGMCNLRRGHILHIVTDSPQSAVLCNVLTMIKVQCTVLNWSVLDE